MPYPRWSLIIPLVLDAVVVVLIVVGLIAMLSPKAEAGAQDCNPHCQVLAHDG